MCCDRREGQRKHRSAWLVRAVVCWACWACFMFLVPLLLSLHVLTFIFHCGSMSHSAWAVISFAADWRLVFLSWQMALTLVSILIAAIPVAYCYPTAFQDLEDHGSKYHLHGLLCCSLKWLYFKLLVLDMFVFCVPDSKQNLHQVPGCRRLGRCALSTLHHCCAEDYCSGNEQSSSADGSWLCSGPWW